MMLLRRLGAVLSQGRMQVIKQDCMNMQTSVRLDNPLAFKSVVLCPMQNFAFAQFPKMFKTQYEKGRLNCRFRTENTSWKRGFKKVKKPYRQSANNALMKRIKIVGPVHDRKMKFKSANHRHQLRKKSRACLKRKARARYAHPTDFKRLRRLIPLMKRASFKANH